MISWPSNSPQITNTPFSSAPQADAGTCTCPEMQVTPMNHSALGDLPQGRPFLSLEKQLQLEQRWLPEPSPLRHVQPKGSISSVLRNSPPQSQIHTLGMPFCKRPRGTATTLVRCTRCSGAGRGQLQRHYGGCEELELWGGGSLIPLLRTGGLGDAATHKDW